MRTTALLSLIAAFGILPSCSSQPPPPAEKPKAASATSDFSLTIYSAADPATFDPMLSLESYGDDLPGYGVVRENRRLILSAGQSRVEFDDVAKGIDPTTVSFKSLTAPDSTAVLEQNFEFDLTGADKLLEKYLGKEIIVTLKQSDNGMAGPRTFKARLLANDPIRYDRHSNAASAGDLVLQTENPAAPIIIQRADTIASIRLADIQSGLVIKPTLTWKIQTDRPGPHDVQVAYQTDGLTWRADYNLLVNKADSAADLSAWVTVLNASGLSYPQTKLKLVAGGVQRLRPRRSNFGTTFGGGEGGGLFGRPEFNEKSLFEYHLYTLSIPTSIPDNSTKQIELFSSRSNIPVSKSFVYYGYRTGGGSYSYRESVMTNRDLGTKSNTEVDVYLTMRNTEKNGLGLPLPAGRVRVYKTDEADSNREFIGEDVIRHTPRDEEILIRLGTAFDIVGERKQTDYQVENKTVTESFEIVLRNRKSEPVAVIIKETLFRWYNWQITQSSDPWDKQDSSTIYIPVKIAAGGEKKVTYTVKYTW